MQFSKMHGLGNDFVIVNAVTQNIFLSSKMIRRLADRHLGIGFDQLLIVEPPQDPNCDFHYRIFNTDGKEVPQCGNGARCFANFVRMKGLTNKREIHVSTIKGYMILSIMDNELVRVNMGEPKFNLLQTQSLIKNRISRLQIDKHAIFCGTVSIGNPHCVIQVKNIKVAAVKILGKALENYDYFPEGVNTGFMQVMRREHIRLRVYERSTGETQACGSGACAAVAVGISQGLLAEEVLVELPGGSLNITWKGYGHPIFMIGPAVHVYDGFIHL